MGNVHNALRTTQEKDGEKYRTYTILKALCKLKEAGIGYRNNDDIVIDENNATATEMLKLLLTNARENADPGKVPRKKGNVKSAVRSGRAMISVRSMMSPWRCTKS